MARLFFISLLLFSAFFSLFTAQASFMSWVSRCCTKGRRKAETSGNAVACNTDDLDRRRFPNPMDRTICRHSERICCVKEIQKTSCEYGKYEASQGESCETFRPYMGGDDFRECCDCCALGIRARSGSDVSCTDVTLSFPCQKAFQDCCNGTKITKPATIPGEPGKKKKCSDNFCQHLCRESPTGGAICHCRSGYRLLGDKISCGDIDECQLGGSTLCGPLQQCANRPGSYQCLNQTEAACKLGRERDNGRCIDVDECARGIHRCGNRQTCINNEGSYSCVCGAGFEASGQNCYDINECTTGRYSCSKDEKCENTEGSYRCAPSTQCPLGTRLKDNRCEDINECDGFPGICRTGFVCSNTIGSYDCRPRPPCPPGQEYVEGKCKVKKVDICSRIKCGSGFVCDPTKRSSPCQDIDECSLSPSKCKSGETCLNYPGGFQCRDPCRGVDCGYGLKCKASRGSYSCEDVDECAILPRRCTGDHEICVNSYASYNCKCRDQFTKNTRTQKCERKDRCTGVNCPGGYRCVIVDQNNFQCKDIDECKETSPPKCRSDQKCVNFPGGSYCTCQDGYRLNRVTNKCEDVDECSERRSGCNQQCDNTPGSYVCRCNSGYQMSSNGRTCRDIDECAGGRSGCSQLCDNTEGSFVCRCRRGYELSSDSRTCRDRDECSVVKCAYRCRNTGGGYECVCPSGYNSTGYYCADNDECQDGTARCKDSEFCFNTYGNYRCIPKKVCPADYDMTSDTRCDRNCPEGDDSCFNKKVQRYSLWTFKLRSDEPPANIFSYRIVTYGYRKRPEVKYYFHRGNKDDKFEIITREENNGVFAYVRNKEKITGPKIYYLEFRGDVVDRETGDLNSRFVHTMYVFISRYDF